MAITALTATNIEPGTWRLDFSSDLADPTFYIWLDGVYVGETPAASYQVAVQPGTAPVFDVFDDDDAVPDPVTPAAVVLQWRKSDVLEVDYYLIEEYVSAAWTERARVGENGELLKRWRTRALEDVTTHQFRVTAVGINANAGTPRTFSVYMVRHPDPPSVGYTYDDGTQVITVDSA